MLVVKARKLTKPCVVIEGLCITLSMLPEKAFNKNGRMNPINTQAKAFIPISPENISTHIPIKKDATSVSHLALP